MKVNLGDAYQGNEAQSFLVSYGFRKTLYSRGKHKSFAGGRWGGRDKESERILTVSTIRVWKKVIDFGNFSYTQVLTKKSRNKYLYTWEIVKSVYFIH